MQLIKQLLNLQEEQDHNKLKITSLSLEKCLDLINSKCSKSKSLLPKSVFWRGDRGMQEALSTGFGTLNSIHTTRKSKKFTNYYTEILDHIPSMSKYPKRSKSIIASTSIHYTKLYGPSIAIIPFDDAKIGVVGREDIWDTEVNLFNTGLRLTINEWNEIFKSFRINDDWNSIVQFANKLKSGDPETKRAFIRALSKELGPRSRPPEEIYYMVKDDFLNILNKSYSPNETGFRYFTGATYPAATFRNSELWIEGGVVIIKDEMLEELSESLENKSKETTP